MISTALPVVVLRHPTGLNFSKTALLFQAQSFV